jgi:hypothetical protein
MEEELSFDNILGADDIENLFAEDDPQENPQSKENTKEETKEEKENKENKENETTEVDVNDLFADPESVGSGKTDKVKEEPESQKDSTSPKNNFYSSIAKALKDEGIFPDLDDETANKATTPEDFRDLIEQQIKAEFDERQKRIDEALNYGVEPSEISTYERTLSYLDSLNEETISEEGEKGETLRKQLIYQDFINRGYSKERATKATQRSIDNGNDIEDAKEALQGNKEYFKNQYDNLITKAKEAEEKEVKDRQERASKLKKSILEDKEVFGELEVDKVTRQKVFDNISKPIYKDPDSGELLTAIQKYERENSTDFLKNVGLLYTLTDGFKNIDKLVKNKVKKEVKSSLRNLENVLNSTSRNSDGSLRLANGFDGNSRSLGNGWDLDI